MASQIQNFLLLQEMFEQRPSPVVNTNNPAPEDKKGGPGGKHSHGCAIAGAYFAVKAAGDAVVAENNLLANNAQMLNQAVSYQNQVSDKMNSDLSIQAKIVANTDANSNNGGDLSKAVNKYSQLSTTDQNAVTQAGSIVDLGNQNQSQLASASSTEVQLASSVISSLGFNNSLIAR